MRRGFLAIAAAAIHVAALSSYPAHAQTPATSAVLFQNVRVFDGKTDGLTASMNVLVQGNVITRISTAPIGAAGATVIDGRGRTLMPGLIDNHVHLFMSASSQAEMLDPKATFETLETKAAEEARLMLLRGFTSARDVGGPVFGIKKAIDHGETSGLGFIPVGR